MTQIIIFKITNNAKGVSWSYLEEIKRIILNDYIKKRLNGGTRNKKVLGKQGISYQ